jgi:hypothetical protein
MYLAGLIFVVMKPGVVVYVGAAAGGLVFQTVVETERALGIELDQV